MKKSIACLSCLLSLITIAHANTPITSHKMLMHTSISSKTSLDFKKFLQGKYVFALRNTETGQRIYTQNGQMNFLPNGGIGQNNMVLQAYAFPSDLLDNTCKLIDLVLPITIAPQATTEINLNINLDAKQPIVKASFNQNDTSTYNYVVTKEIYDSLGDQHHFALYFIKAAENNWSAYITIDDQLITRDQIQFSSSGALYNTGNLSSINFYPKNGANPSQPIILVLTNSTQYATPSYVKFITQNGNTVGQLTSFDIDNIGDINLTYSNDVTITFAKIAVFPNTASKA